MKDKVLLICLELFIGLVAFFLINNWMVFLAIILLLWADNIAKMWREL